MSKRRFGIAAWEDRAVSHEGVRMDVGGSAKFIIMTCQSWGQALKHSEHAAREHPSEWPIFKVVDGTVESCHNVCLHVRCQPTLGCETRVPCIYGDALYQCGSQGH